MMNNKAIVRDTTSRTFFSEHGHAFVTEEEDKNVYLNNTKYTDISTVALKEISGDKEFKFVRSKSYGLVPHTINVLDTNDMEGKQQSFPSVRVVAKDNTADNSDINKIYKKVYVSRLQPTNIKYTPVSTIVYGEPLGESKIQMSGTSVNINSKAEIIIPEFSSYGNMTLTVQKDCFIEFKLPDNVIDVIKLPTYLIYSPGYIKGTFTKSGRYSMIIEYSDGEQIIDIIVPYYERLL